MNCLFLIPARGGSKGIPKKNIKLLNGKPLIHYSIEFAQKLTTNNHICVSTDSEEIAEIASQTGLKIPFIRPENLATDKANSNDVIKHAIAYYESENIFYDVVILLQPTSPFRLVKHVNEALSIFDENVDMVCSFNESKANPYYNLFEEDKKGYLQQSKIGNYTRRQDCPKVYEQNGSLYVISVKSLKNKEMSDFSKIKKYVLEERYSNDIDTMDDWNYCEYLLKNNKI